jgi:hypothetical protein
MTPGLAPKTVRPFRFGKLQRASTAIDEGVTEHLRAALTLWDITRHELEELVVHFAAYLGWNLARHLDDPRSMRS